MIRRILIPGLVLVALGACRSASGPATPSPEPARAEATGAGTQARQVPQDPRAEVEALLAAAQSAVIDGEAEEFQDCEAAILQKLMQSPEIASQSAAGQTYLGSVLDKLARLAEQLENDDMPGEPPEPQPVPEERIAAVQEQAREAHFDLPVIVNSEVTSLVDFYTGRYRERFIAALERGSTYLPYIRAELANAKLPQDLAYLPLVESAFNPRARSRAKAQGLWQFVAGTAHLYGLRCDGLVDERNDPYLATQAAVRLLADLYGNFGSWELALAAYNSGAGRVQGAVKKAKGNTDFWTARRYLRRETRNYVPALWAVLVAVKNPKTYDLPTVEDKPVCLARVPVEGALDIDVLAERAQFDSEELAQLNPALSRRLTPASGSYQLAVPCGREQHIAEVIASIPPRERVRRYLYVVKQGDTPASIARRYGSTVDAIMAANSLRNPRALRVGQTLVVPRAGVPAPARAGATHRGEKRQVAASVPDRYVVRRGDTLAAIARRFGTSAEELQRRNGLQDTTIRPGDVLLLAR